MKILNKKTLNLLQAVVLIILLIMYMFGNIYVDDYGNTSKSFISLIGSASIVQFIFIALVIVNAVMCFASALVKELKNEKDSKAHTTISISIVIIGVVAFINSMSTKSGITTTFYNIDVLPAYLLMALVGINLVLSMFKRSKLVVKDNNNASNNPNDTIDDLKKYKELLDQGIITQEEFDTKKKEILK